MRFINNLSYYNHSHFITRYKEKQYNDNAGLDDLVTCWPNSQQQRGSNLRRFCACVLKKHSLNLNNNNTDVF